jgi:hypothetical protein
MNAFLLAAAQVEVDDQNLRAMPRSFDTLRRDYRWRRDWSGIQVVGAEQADRESLRQLGFAANP